MPEGYRLIISPEAMEEIEKIHAYISLDSPDNAGRMIEHILKSIELLQHAPHRFVVARPHKRLKHAIRSLPVPPYMIFFRVQDEERAVLILTVRHGARKRPRNFG